MKLYHTELVIFACINQIQQIDMVSSTQDLSSIPFVSMITANKMGICEYDLVSGQLFFINDYFKILNWDLSGATPRNLQQLRSLIYPQDVGTFDVAIKVCCSRDAVAFTVKYRLMDAAGRVAWMETHLYSYGKGADGKPTRIAGLTRNIHCREEERKRMLKDNTDYRNLLKAIPDFIFIFDENLIFQDIILPEGLNLFHKKEEMIGQHGSLIYSDEICALFISSIRECLDTGQPKEIEYPVDLFESRYYYKARITPLAGRKAFLLISDISDRIKRMENLMEAKLHAEEADRMKTAFIANMSHEIRTPLNSIIGFTGIIAAEEDPGLKEEYLEIVNTNNDLLLQLINDILDLSLIESGKYEMSLIPTNIHNLIDEVANAHKVRTNPEVEFKVIYPANATLTVVTDANRVKQILFNFLSNAAKNTTRGSITLGVEEGHRHLRFYVTDTGRGIPEDKLGTIFDRFEKLDNFVQGTGLGLSIAANLVRHLGGKINVQSKVGQGSTFSFTLPYADSLPAIDNSTQGKSGKRERKRILIVEDSDSKYNFAKEILEKKFDTIRATTEDETVQLLLAEYPDFILVDIHTGGMKGIDIIKHICCLSLRIPIVGITSSNYYLEQQWAMESGCNEVIAYPYSASRLHEVVLANM